MIISKYRNRNKEFLRREQKLIQYCKKLDKLIKKTNDEKKNYLVKKNIYFLQTKIQRIKSFL